MTLDKDQATLYRKTMDQAKSQLYGVDAEMGKGGGKNRGPARETSGVRKVARSRCFMGGAAVPW